MTIFIVPKKNIHLKVIDYIPISLYNVIYKFISKVIIANHLKVVLPHVISDSQNGFVLGKLITDNVLIAYKLIHYLRQKRKGKKGFRSLKLYKRKVYDRLE